MAEFNKVKDHENLGVQLRDISEKLDDLQKSTFQERPQVSEQASKAHSAITDLRHELEELARKQFPDVDSSRLLHCYYPPRDRRGGLET